MLLSFSVALQLDTHIMYEYSVGKGQAAYGKSATPELMPHVRPYMSTP